MIIRNTACGPDLRVVLFGSCLEVMAVGCKQGVRIAWRASPFCFYCFIDVKTLEENTGTLGCLMSV